MVRKPVLIGAAAVVALAAFFTVFAAEWDISTSGDVLGTVADQPAPLVTHLPTPDPLSAIYMSQCVVGTPSFREELVSFVDATSLNAIVIDVKDYTGTIGFRAEDPRLAAVSLTECGASDMKEFVQSLHDKGIYAIARITVFQDPSYTKAHPEQAVQSVSRPGQPWKDNKGLSFVDVSSKPYWDYIETLSKETYALGFDELNYDYIRYPSDGPMKDAAYVNPDKPAALEAFFKHLHGAVKPTGAVISADLFGYVTVHTDDLGIGQVLERAFPYFDYIAPMVYPSHYNKGFAGLADVNSDPYTVVYTSLIGAVARAAATTTVVATLDETPIASTSPQLYTKVAYPATIIRPWLQSFDYPVAYTPAMVAAQIKANEDAGLSSYLFWDAANKYTSLRAILSTSNE
jgi:hypothetical protein